MGAFKANNSVYDEVFDDSTQKNTRRQMHCPFCLLNILFSDAFSEKFARLGDTASREELDAGKRSDENFGETYVKLL